VPPLRERRDDILPLAETFLARERQRRTTPARAFARETSDALKGYAWPGNVRELRSVIERAALYTTSDVVASTALPRTSWSSRRRCGRGATAGRRLKEIEKEYIRYVLDQVAGQQTRAAAILGISRKALWEKRRRYGIR